MSRTILDRKLAFLLDNDRLVIEFVSVLHKTIFRIMLT